MYIIAIEIYQFCLNFILGFIFLKLYFPSRRWGPLTL